MEADVIDARAAEGVAAVQNATAIEWSVSLLLDDMKRHGNAPVELVPLKVRHNVRQELVEVLRAIAIGHDDRQPLVVACFARVEDCHELLLCSHPCFDRTDYPAQPCPGHLRSSSTSCR